MPLVKYKDTLDALINKTVRDAVPGLSILVVKPDGVQWARSFGVSDVATHSPATEHTVYMWFSVTKLVTATCIMQLVERCQLNIDEPVLNHYAQFQLVGPSNWMRSVTIRNLLNHTSGLANPIPITWIHRPAEATPDPDGFLKNLLVRNSRLRFEPGSTASYSNLNYLLLGQIISSVSQEPYQDYVRKNVLIPLRMSRTDFVYFGEMSRLAATGYQKRRSLMAPLLRLMLPRWVFGARANGFRALNRFYVDGAAYGGLIGSAFDAAVFLQSHLNGGAVEGQRILSPASVKLMQTMVPHSPHLHAGLGWLRRNGRLNREHRFVEHLGGGAGYFSVMRLYEDASVGVVIMGNSTSYNYQSILSLLAEGSCT